MTDRIQYCLDTIVVGDAALAVTGALRINYETWAMPGRRCTPTSFRGFNRSPT